MELKEKEAFFSLYWGQKIGKVNGYHKNVASMVHGSNIFNISYLELKSLEDISDEDLHLLAKIYEKTAHNIILKGDEISFDFYCGDKTESLSFVLGWDRISCDFLRANGYTLDWTNSEGRTYTVAELVSEGVVKLKER